MKIDEIYNHIIQLSVPSIIVIDGSSGAGKTNLLYQLKDKTNKHVVIMSDEKICDILLEKAKKVAPIESLIEKISCDIFCLEDMDILASKPIALDLIAEIVNILSKRCIVIITGIDMMRRIREFILKLNNITYFVIEK